MTRFRERHQGEHFFDKIYVKSDFIVLGDFTFGNAAVDTLILKGRVATMTAAGSAIQIGSAYTYGEGQELRWQVVDWTGKSTFNGMYLRSEAATVSAAGKSIRGTEIYGVCNNVTMTTGSLWGTLTYAYCKGVGAVTINNMYAGQFELTWDASRTEDCTISTEAAVILAKVTGGRCADYTKIHGMIIRFGEMDGDSQKFGNAIHIEDDGDMSGTSTFSKGIFLEAGGDIMMDVDGTWATAGLDMSGASFAAGSAILIGTFGSPTTYAGNELVELHGQIGAAAETKPLMRVRNSGYASGATTGFIHTLQVQAYGTGTNNAAYILGQNIEVGVKGNSTMSGEMRGLLVKVEDLGNTLNATGDIYGIKLGWQFDATSTIGGESSYINVLKEGAINKDCNSVIRLQDNSGSGAADFLLDFVSNTGNPLASGDKTGGAKDYAIRVDVQGTAYLLQLYAE